MTSVPTTQPRRRFGRSTLPVIVAAILVVAVVFTLLARTFFLAPADPLQGGTPVEVTSGPLVLGISATGNVEPRERSELAFATAAGIVSEIFVAEGDAVARGDALVQLAINQLSAAVTAAEAALAQAEADLLALQEGATAEQVAAARAEVAAAQGALTQTAGSVTGADIAAAQADIAEARARLAELEAGAGNDELTRARTTLAEARADRERQRTALSAAKTDAERGVAEAANAVREAQNAYSTAYWDLEYVKSTGNDPRTERSLTDAQTADFVTAFENARLALADAEARLNQAGVDLETAKQNEISGLAEADARIERAQADLDELLLGADTDELAAARAQLARAEAALARLTGAERQGSLAAQQANLSAAEARLAELLADPRASDLARAEARVAQEQARLEQARIDLAAATLRAPFAGTVATINVAPGEAIGQQPPVVLIDTSSFVIEVTVDEVDVARVAVGQPVEVLIDALGEPALSGEVRLIEPQSLAENSVTAYRVTIAVEPGDRPLRPGMTASATIVAERRDTAISVPLQAVQTRDGQSFVQLVTSDAAGSQVVNEQPVTTGLRAGERIEIVSGLEAGQQVLIVTE